MTPDSDMDAADIWDEHEELLEDMLESDDPVERGWAEAIEAAAAKVNGTAPNGQPDVGRAATATELKEAVDRGELDAEDALEKLAVQDASN